MKIGQNYINGKWVDSESKLTTINPNTGSSFGEIPNSNKEEVESAIASAKEAFINWSKTSIEERIKILQNVVNLLIEEYGEEGMPSPLKNLITDEVGKRLPEADIEVIESSDMIQYFVDNATSILADRKIPLNQTLWASKESTLHFEPKGVVAIIKAWNYPLEVPIWSIAPALVSGNTVVFKPSEHSTFVATELVKLFEKAGLPKGVLNMICGNGQTGESLVNSKGVNMISFTGSQKVGKQINISAANRFIKCVLELSGNDAAIVHKSADLELTSNGLVWGAFCNSGQVCVGVKRAFIDSEIAKKIIPLIVAKTNKLEKGKDFGPLISAKQLEIVESFVQDAVSKGATVLTGGNTIKQTDGFYYQPTVLIGVTSQMKLMNEECFGNILPIMEYSSLDSAIDMANDSIYGLGASVWCSDNLKAEYISSKLEAGMVWVNDVNVAFPEAPWSGIKNSGCGIDLSEFGLYEYVNLKHINKENSSDTSRIWWYPY